MKVTAVTQSSLESMCICGKCFYESFSFFVGGRKENIFATAGAKWLLQLLILKGKANGCYFNFSEGGFSLEMKNFERMFSSVVAKQLSNFVILIPVQSTARGEVLTKSAIDDKQINKNTVIQQSAAVTLEIIVD